ncbi:MAG TPA: hypothetical protein VK808_12430 [Bacteroidia bacterium]|jgi:hypothetical protein|nr:hypothetical protein [Bacteroidia bacterium]
MAVSTCAVAQIEKAPIPNKDSCLLPKKADSIEEQKDIGDVLRNLFKIKAPPGPDCTLEKPGKLLFSLAPAAGYTLEGGPIASVTINASLYTSDPANTNLSVFTFGGQYSLHNQLMLPVISDIWTKNNKYDLLGDWRYYSYPSKTYGLGSNTSLLLVDPTYYSYIKVYQEVLRHFGSNYYGGIGYNFDDHFNIRDYGDETDFQQYNEGATKTVSSGPIVHLMYDSRTNINNPKDAFYASVIYRENLTFLGSDQNWQYLQVEVRKYFRLSSHDVLAFWSWNEFTSGHAPYFDLPSNQWDTYSNTGRGYIQGFYKGTNMVYLEAEYRFGISRNGLFGGVIFSNAGSATQWPGNKFEYVDPGEGAGIRIKFNKYSDVNLCIDYAIGLDGSHGLFFNLGEVF